MKFISILIQLVLLGFVLILALIAATKPRALGAEFVFLALIITILWFLAINLYKRNNPEVYLPKFLSAFGLLMSIISFYYLAAKLLGENVPLATWHIFLVAIGGLLVCYKAYKKITRQGAQARH
jgi:uncharacterized membrane protein